jgi:hypothetical protein
MAIAYERAKTLNECSQADLDGSPLKLWEQIRAMEDELKIARGRHNTARTARDILIKEDQEHRRKFGELLWENPWLGTPSWDDILFRVEKVSYWQDQAEKVNAKLSEVRKERDEWKQTAERRLRLAEAIRDERDRWRKKVEEPTEELRIAQGSAGQLAAKVENQRKEITRLLAEKADLSARVVDRWDLVRKYASQVRECKRNVNDYYSKLERVRRYAEEDLKDIRVSHIGESILDILDD